MYYTVIHLLYVIVAVVRLPEWRARFLICVSVFFFIYCLVLLSLSKHWFLLLFDKQNMVMCSLILNILTWNLWAMIFEVAFYQKHITLATNATAFSISLYKYNIWEIYHLTNKWCIMYMTMIVAYLGQQNGRRGCKHSFTCTSGV